MTAKAATKAKPKSDAGNRHRKRMAKRMRDQSAEAADIGEIPAVVNPERKEACRYDLGLFLKTYYPNSTGLCPFSEDHERVIARLQKCILEGGRFINAVYRGFAKTSIATNAAQWATLYGHRKFVVAFSASAEQAQDMIDSIKTELAENDLLYEDFPEVCHAIRELEGKYQRCHSQTHNGELTHVGWRADRVILPRIAGSVAAGAILAARGMTGSGTRGLLRTMPDGTKPRPDFVIVDDPQTEETASTPGQVRKRLKIIVKSILKLAGHRKSLAIVVNATVIAPDDVVEQLLNPVKHPSWLGERIKMVRQWATAHQQFWLTRYAELRNTFDHTDPDDQKRAHAEATALYVANRAEADAGCVVSWEHCLDEDAGEVSAVQHAYNMLIDDGPEVFACECQNEPLKSPEEQERLTNREIAARTNGLARQRFPSEVGYVTTFIDLQDALLYYAVAAWHPDFTGYVVDYGTFPDQRRKYFTLRDAQRTLQDEYPGETQERQWFQGLTRLTDMLCGRDWVRLDGVVMRVGQCLIDANYGLSTKTVKKFCLTSKWSPILLPSHGRGIKAGDAAMSQYRPKPGEQFGHNWIKRPDAEAKGLRNVSADVNYWKSIVHNRLRLKFPSKQAISFWGDDDREHEMFADHLTAEVPIKTEGRGRVVEQWDLKPEKPDNHYLDCLVGCAVGASILGAHVDGAPPVAAAAKALKLSELYAQKHGRRRR